MMNLLLSDDYSHEILSHRILSDIECENYGIAVEKILLRISDLVDCPDLSSVAVQDIGSLLSGIILSLPSTSKSLILYIEILSFLLSKLGQHRASIQLLESLLQVICSMDSYYCTHESFITLANILVHLSFLYRALSTQNCDECLNLCHQALSYLDDTSFSRDSFDQDITNTKNVLTGKIFKEIGDIYLIQDRVVMAKIEFDKAASYFRKDPLFIRNKQYQSCLLILIDICIKVHEFEEAQNRCDTLLALEIDSDLQQSVHHIRHQVIEKHISLLISNKSIEYACLLSLQLNCEVFSFSISSPIYLGKGFYNSRVICHFQPDAASDHNNFSPLELSKDNGVKDLWISIFRTDNDSTGKYSFVLAICPKLAASSENAFLSYICSKSFLFGSIWNSNNKLVDVKQLSIFLLPPNMQIDSVKHTDTSCLQIRNAELFSSGGNISCFQYNNLYLCFQDFSDTVLFKQALSYSNITEGSCSC